jgi:hypothetical protein
MSSDFQMGEVVHGYGRRRPWYAGIQHFSVRVSPGGDRDTDQWYTQTSGPLFPGSCGHFSIILWDVHPAKRNGSYICKPRSRMRVTAAAFLQNPRGYASFLASTGFRPPQTPTTGLMIPVELAVYMTLNFPQTIVLLE